MATTKARSKSGAGKGKKSSSKLAALKSLIMGSPKKSKTTSSSSSAKAKAKPAPKAAKGKVAASEKQASTAKGKGAAQASTSAKSVAGSAASGKASAKAAAAMPQVTGKAAKAPATGKAAKAGGRGKSGKQLTGSPFLNGADSGADSVCREVACEGLATTGGYCRMHYIKNWKKIKRKELILKEKKLNQYIEELVAKYPDKYIEAIRQDLANDKDFAKVIYDLDLDESVDDFEMESESVDSLIDNIRRDFEDEGESF